MRGGNSTSVSSRTVINKADGNLCKAADTLGVHRNTLTRKIKELKIKGAPLQLSESGPEVRVLHPPSPGGRSAPAPKLPR